MNVILGAIFALFVGFAIVWLLVEPSTMLLRGATQDTVVFVAMLAVVGLCGFISITRND